MRPILSYVAIVLLAAACVQRPAPTTHYRGVIERVETSERLPTQHYSVADGPTTMTRVRVRLADPRAGGDGGTLTVLIHGLGEVAAGSTAGDEVSFDYPGRLPAARELTLAELRNYRVRPKAR